MRALADRSPMHNIARCSLVGGIGAPVGVSGITSRTTSDTDVRWFLRPAVPNCKTRETFGRADGGRICLSKAPGDGWPRQGTDNVFDCCGRLSGGCQTETEMDQGGDG